ncbi:MAG: RIP metalloprotease RseP [Candidatus Methylomirabilales bacterium]
MTLDILIYAIIPFIIMLGILIFFHEFGHFLVAKRAGVGVLKFSLGFGRRIFGFKKGETEYLVSAIPLGGYVKMVGEDPREVVVDQTGQAFDSAGQPLDLERSFAHKSVWTRIAVVLAGPGANFLLAFLLFWAVFVFIGTPLSETIVGEVERDSPAGHLRPGDKIVAVDGHAVFNWRDLDFKINEASGRPVDLEIERGQERIRLTVEPRGREVTTAVVPPQIGRVIPNFPAAEAGLRSGDKIVAVDGEAIDSWQRLAFKIRSSPGNSMTLTVERNGERFEATVTPRLSPAPGEEGRQVGLIGIEAGSGYDQRKMEVWDLGISPRFVRLDPFFALYQAGNQTAAWTVTVLWALVKIIEGQISPRTIGGPILMAQMTGEQAQRGLDRLIFLTAILSVNLAVLNLLPIPILDGGHLFFFFIELLRGKPVSVQKREMAQRVGLVLLVALMIFAFYNDVFRLLGRP